MKYFSQVLTYFACPSCPTLWLHGLSLECQSVILCHLSVYLLVPDADQWLTLDRRAYDEGEGQARERLSQLLHRSKNPDYKGTAFVNTVGIQLS
jgi:hypothetical protein